MTQHQEQPEEKGKMQSYIFIGKPQPKKGNRKTQPELHTDLSTAQQPATQIQKHLQNETKELQLISNESKIRLTNKSP